ncbi:cytochrome b [Psychrobacter sp. HD31]|uniref:cytochrome b n=1 Tax=Psychrobacter sp. HD31 TaxID=3112003 RepID=UPI003DA4A3E3
MANQKWSVVTRIIHWTIAILLLATWISIEYVDNLDLHKSLGVVVLLFAVARIINRITAADPVKLNNPKWQKIAAESTHGLLYLLLLAMPILGILRSVYAGYPVSVFAIFEIPVFVTPDREIAKILHEWHTNIVWTLVLMLTAIHIFGALYNQFILKNNVINRIR